MTYDEIDEPGIPATGQPGSLDDQAYRRLRTALMEGAFAPGNRLSIRKVASALGVSSMPVRSALRRLVSEQALDTLPSGTAVVPRLTKQAFAEIGALRAELEPMALRIAAPTLTSAAHQRLAQLLEDHDDARTRTDPDAVLRADRDFLFTIYRSCEAPMLLQFIEALWLRRGPVFWEARWSLMSHGAVRHHHAEILTALREGNVYTAATALQEEIESATDFLIAHHRFTADPPLVQGIKTLKRLRSASDR